ncbi:MAG: hypothetical protein RR396_01855 [Clostridiales bacterium]
MINDFYAYYLANLQELPEDYGDYSQEQRIINYIAGMTDTYAIEEHKRLFS